MIKGMSRTEGEAIMKGRGAITISIFALLLAVFSLVSNGNSSKILSNTLSINDTWSFYQAKSIKQNIYELRVEPDPNELARYDREKREIMAEARRLEADRDEAKKRSPWYSMAITFLQIAMVLSSTSILAVSMELLWASVGCAVFASMLFSNGYWLFF
jgi:Domain of unknown function (DUF4337)